MARELDMRTVEQYGDGLKSAMELWIIEQERRSAERDAHEQAQRKAAASRGKKH
jgi:hypothetical protein